MTELTITPLEDDLSFGARVRGVTIENVFDEGVRAQLRELFVDRGMIVFEDIEHGHRSKRVLSKRQRTARTDSDDRGTPRSGGGAERPRQLGRVRGSDRFRERSRVGPISCSLRLFDADGGVLGAVGDHTLVDGRPTKRDRRDIERERTHSWNDRWSASVDD